MMDETARLKHKKMNLKKIKLDQRLLLYVLKSIKHTRENKFDLNQLNRVEPTKPIYFEMC